MLPILRFLGPILVFALASCAGDTPTGPLPKDPGWIAVSMNVPQTLSWDLFRTRPDGTDVQRITRVGNASSPSWSPDARRIAYQASRSNGFGGTDTEIRIHDLSTGATSQVTQFLPTAYDSAPLWTADGATILFLTNRITPEGGLYGIRPDGTGLTWIRDVKPGASVPDLSRDGRQIVVAYPDGLYVGSLTGTSLQRIAVSGPNERFDAPKWSPDGRRVAFVSIGRGIFLINADGSGLVPLPTPGRGSGTDRQPIWSPDGTRIAFVGPEGLYVGGTDGQSFRLVLQGQIFDPAWTR